MLTVAHDTIDFGGRQIGNKQHLLANGVLNVHHELALGDDDPLFTSYIHLQRLHDLSFEIRSIVSNFSDAKCFQLCSTYGELQAFSAGSGLSSFGRHLRILHWLCIGLHNNGIVRGDRLKGDTKP